jgi:hypothetical protein
MIYDSAIQNVDGDTVMTKRIWVKHAITVVGAILAGATAVVAHHSFAMFDQTKKVTVNGSVTSFEWTNPHAYILMDEPGATAKDPVKHWTVELGSPSILQQSGWKYSDIKHGDKVKAVISPLRNGDPGGLLEYVTLADGRSLGNGPGRAPAGK